MQFNCNVQICNYERLCMSIQIGHYAIIQICQPLHETSQNSIPTLPMHWYRTEKTAVQQNAKKGKGEGTIDQDVELLTNQGIFYRTRVRSLVMLVTN